MIHVAAAAGCAALCGVGGLLVPRLVAGIPEPDSQPDAAPDEPPKEPYAAIAVLPGLAWKAGAAGVVAGGLVGGYVGWEWPLLFLVPLVPVLVGLAVIDWRTHLLPTKVVWPATLATAALVVTAWAASGDTDDLARAGWGFLIAYGSFYLLWFVHPRGLGYGDVRLAGVLGLALGYLGWGELLVGLYAGFLLGGVGGGLLSVLRVVERRAFPFGPFMIVGALVGLVVGESVLNSLAAG